MAPPRPTSATAWIAEIPGTLTLCILTLLTAAAQSIWDGQEISQAIGAPVAQLFEPSGFISRQPGQLIPTWLTLFTYVFPHGGWWHALPNVIGLFFFGAIAERVIGTRKLIPFYFISGAVGAFGHALVPPHQSGPDAGASLAMFGTIGAYAADRWSAKSHTATQRLALLAAEISVVTITVAWLILRAVPPATNLTCSIAYHFIPLLLMWLLVRLYNTFFISRRQTPDPKRT